MHRERDRRRHLGAVAERLRGDAVPPADAVTARVMAQVRELPRHGACRRLFTVGRVVMAASVVGVIALGAAALARPGADQVEFTLSAPLATRVTVVGDFNGWDRDHPDFRAVRDPQGTWTLVAPIAQGHHRYAFLVDDSLWVADPRAPLVSDPDFGVPNSALVIAQRQP